MTVDCSTEYTMIKDKIGTYHETTGIMARDFAIYTLYVRMV